MIEYLTSTPLGTLSERQALEDAFCLRLAGLTIQCGGFLRHLGPFSGGDEDPDQDFYRALATKAPAILVTTAAGSTEHKSVRMLDDEDTIMVEVLAVSTHWRDPLDRTRTRSAGTTIDPGVYHILRAARRLLMGRETGIAGAKSIKHAGEVALVNERGMCVWRAIYRVPVRISQELAEVDRDEWADLQLVGVMLTPEGIT